MTRDGRSRILRSAGFRWPGVEVQAYKDDDGSFRDVTRRLLAAPETAAFDVRYFELAPGGHTSLERHRHVHVVVCVRGGGRVRLDESYDEVGSGDVVYVAPDTPHRFENPTDEPFGFVCIVDRDRDRPVPLGG